MRGLKIPKRLKGKYEYIKCKQCDRLIKDRCIQSGKEISRCKFKEKHRYILRVYVPRSGSKYIVKTFETRDYDEFKKESEAFLNSLQGVEFEVESNEKQPPKEIPIPKTTMPITSSQSERASDILPLTLRSVLAKYTDFLYDIGVPEHKKVERKEKTVKDYIKNIGFFLQALELKGIDPNILPITEIDDFHVGYLHAFIEKSKKPNGELRFTDRTYNNIMSNNRSFFKYMIEELGYSIRNPFTGVQSKDLEQENLIVEFKEFDHMIRLVNEKNGEFQKKDKGKYRTRNRYRPWLKHAFKLGLETGERRDGVMLMKWPHVNMEEGIITIPNYKVNQIQKRKKKRMIAITEELHDLLMDLGYKKYKGEDQYIIAPDYENRNTIKEWLSRAFTHYWKLTGYNEKISFKHLRKTYATLFYSVFGDKTKAVTDQNVDTIMTNYLNKKAIVSSARNMSLRVIEKQLQKSNISK